MVDQKISVLVVDDDDMNRMVLRMHMAKGDFQVYEADNGLVAYEALCDNPHIVHVVLDLNMPVMDGFTFIENCNVELPDRDLKIHITSAYSQKDFLVFVADSNICTKRVVNFYSKPYPMSQLLSGLQ